MSFQARLRNKSVEPEAVLSSRKETVTVWYNKRAIRYWNNSSMRKFSLINLIDMAVERQQFRRLMVDMGVYHSEAVAMAIALWRDN